MRDVIETIKINISDINDLRTSAMAYAEYDGYRRCVKELFAKELRSKENAMYSYKKNLQEAERDEQKEVIAYFAGKLNDTLFDIEVLKVQVDLLLELIPKYIFPIDYDSKVKAIIAQEDEEKLLQDIMDAFAVTTKKGADAFYSSVFLGLKGTGTKNRAGIKKTKDGIEQSAGTVHYLKALSKKQIEQNIILFVCEKIARSSGYLFHYDKYLYMTWDQIAHQIETLYSSKALEGFTCTADTAKKIVLKRRKEGGAQEAQEK